MNKEELRERIVTYNEAILSALEIDDKAFFSLPIWRREEYVQLTKEFPKELLSFIEPVKVRRLTNQEMQSIRNELIRYIDTKTPFGIQEESRTIAQAQIDLIKGLNKDKEFIEV